MTTIMTRRAIAALLICLCHHLAQAGEGNYVKKWIWTKEEIKKIEALEKEVKTEGGVSQIETENWLVSTELGARFTAETAVFMEIFYAVFKEIFDFQTGVEYPDKPKIVIFKSAENYAKVGLPGSRGVFCFRKSDDKAELIICTYMPEGRLNNFSNCYHPVIQHEGTHCLLKKIVGSHYIPSWLTEGMATFYEYWDYRSQASPSGNRPQDVDARKKRLTLSKRKHYLRDSVREAGGKYPPLSYLLKLTTLKEWDVDNMGPRTRMHYALAESFADFIISDKEARKHLKTIFMRLTQGEKELLTEEEIKFLEPRWHKHLRQMWGINAKSDT